MEAEREVLRRVRPRTNHFVGALFDQHERPVLSCLLSDLLCVPISYYLIYGDARYRPGRCGDDDILENL